MKEQKINFDNVFEVSQDRMFKRNHSGYVRIVKYLDKKKHIKPLLQEKDMDIIASGNFKLTNENGKSVFSFS